MEDRVRAVLLQTGLKIQGVIRRITKLVEVALVRKQQNGLMVIATTIVVLGCGQSEKMTQSTEGSVIPYAGNGLGAFAGDGGAALEGQLHGPAGLAVDIDGNLFIATDHRIRKVDISTKKITTVAGTGNPGYSGDGGPGLEGKLKNPTGVAVDSMGNIYVADHDNGRIRRIDGETGVITTVAGGGKPKVLDGGYLDTGDGGLAIEAFFRIPMDVVLDGRGNLFFISNQTRVRRVDAVTGIITTLAGDGKKGFSGDGGPGELSSLAEPSGLAVDKDGNVYISDTENSRIRRVDSTTGIITTVAGIGKHGSFIETDWYIGDQSSAVPTGFFKHGDCRIRPDPVEGAGYSGDGGQGNGAKIAFPVGLEIGPDDQLYIADYGNNRVRKLNLRSGLISTIVEGGQIGDEVVRCAPGTTFNRGDSSKDGNAGSQNFNSVVDIAIGSNGDLFIADFLKNRVMKLSVNEENDR